MKRRTKRKIKRFFFKHSVLIIIVCMFPSLFLLSTAYSVLTENIEVQGISNIISSEIPNICQSNISYEKTGGWSGTHVVDITINNNSDELMYSWVLKLTNIEGINSIYGPVNTTILNNIYYMTPQDYKAQIPAHGSQTLTLQINTNREVDDIFENLTLADCGKDTEHSKVTISSGGASIKLGTFEKQIDAQAELESSGNWDGNHYKITIANNSQKTYEGWRAILYYGDEEYKSIYNYYNYNHEVANKRLSLFSNQSFKPNSKVEFYVVVNTANANYLPDIVAAGLIVE